MSDKTAPFIIWTLQRTGGTNLMARLVELAGLRWAPHEPFNPGRVYGSITHAWQATQDADALRQAVEAVAAKGEVIKHCVETVPWAVTEALIEATAKAGYRHLFLYRRDAVDRLLSLHFAKETGIWAQDMKAMKALTGAPEIHEEITPQKQDISPLPVEKLLAHERRSVALLEKAWHRLKALGAEPVALAYEEVYRAPSLQAAQAVLERVLAALGIAAPDMPAWTQAIVGRGDQGTRDRYREIPGYPELVKRAAQLPVFLKSSYKPTWQLLAQDHPWIVRAFVDVLPQQIVEGQTFEIGGVVVLSQEAPDGLRLTLQVGNQEQTVEWGIDSPVMAKQFPAGKNSSCARWRAKVQSNTILEAISLNLIDAQAEMLLVAEIDFSPHQLQVETSKIERSGTPYHFETLLVVTYGRSGSTLMMGILNSIPGALIRGENNDFCFGLYKAYAALADAHRQHKNEFATTKPFFGANDLDPEKFLADARDLVRRQLVPAGQQPIVWGFKEIRWLVNKNPTDGKAYLDFMERLLPRPGFIFLTRDLGQVANSAWWRKKSKDQVVAELSRFEKICNDWAKKRSNVFHIDYSDICDITPRLRSLFEWIGAPWDEEAIRKVLTTEHSYDNKPENIQRRKDGGAGVEVK